MGVAVRRSTARKRTWPVSVHPGSLPMASAATGIVPVPAYPVINQGTLVVARLPGRELPMLIAREVPKKRAATPGSAMALVVVPSGRLVRFACRPPAPARPQKSTHVFAMARAIASPPGCLNARPSFVRVASAIPPVRRAKTAHLGSNAFYPPRTG